MHGSTKFMVEGETKITVISRKYTIRDIENAIDGTYVGILPDIGETYYPTFVVVGI